MNSELKIIQEAYIGMLDEAAGKFIHTHKGTDEFGIPKPNPAHPAYAKHKEVYTAKRAEIKPYIPRDKGPSAKTVPESPVKLHHIDTAISNSYPDVEPYEHLARQFPALHKADGKLGSKLMDHLDAVVKKNKVGKDFNDYVSKAHADFEADKAYE